MRVLQHQSNRHRPVRRDRCALDVILPFYLSTRCLKVRAERGLNVNKLLKNWLRATQNTETKSVFKTGQSDLISLDNKKRWGTNDGAKNGKTLIFNEQISRWASKLKFKLPDRRTSAAPETPGGGTQNP